MDRYFVMSLLNYNKWKMIVICTSLRFGGTLAETRVLIFLIDSVANVLSARLWTEFRSQYHLLFFTFKEDMSLNVLFHPWCFFILSYFASNILFLPFTLEQIKHRILLNVPSPSWSCWNHRYFVAQFCWNLYQNQQTTVRTKIKSKFFTIWTLLHCK